MNLKLERQKVSNPTSLGAGLGGAKPAGQNHVITITAWAVAACFTWLSIIYLPRDVLSPTLDSSHQGALSYFAEKGMQFGQEVIPTYGPLGYLVPEIYDGTFFNRKLIWELLSKLVIAGIVIWLARHLPILNRVLFLSFIWILSPRFGNSYPEVLFYFAIAGAGLILSRDDRWRHYFVAPLLVFLACVSLIKFTLLVYSLLVIVFLSVYWAYKKNWRMCVLLPSAYAALLLSAWRITGQDWASFSAWIATSLEVSSGYQQSMGVDAAPGILPLAIAVASIAISLVGVSVYDHRRSLQSCVPLLGLTAGYWISWKHGLIRADDHVNLFFGFCLLSFSCFPAFAMRPPSRVRLRQFLSAVGGVLCLAGLYVQNSASSKDGPTHSNSDFLATARDLMFLTSYRTEMDASLSLQRQRFECPQIKAEVGQSTVDVFGHYQGIALLNALNYHPRPVFQSYNAYTPFFIRTNAEFYRSDAAPSFVISTLYSIDYRLPTLDDSEALRVLLLDYELVLQEKGFLLWRRSAQRRAASEEVSESETREIALGETVPLSEGNVWCVMDIKESTLGKLRRFLYKPPILFISVTDKDGRSTAYRILPSIARCGFILDPYLQSQADIVGLKTRSAPKPEHVSSFTLVTDNSSRKYFDSHVTIHFSRLAPFAPDDL
jgi:hypothetical protein